MTDARLRIIFAGVFALTSLALAGILRISGAGTPEWLPPMITAALFYGLGQAQTNGGLGSAKK